jgi:hypothetical protein
VKYSKGTEACDNPIRAFVRKWCDRIIEVKRLILRRGSCNQNPAECCNGMIRTHRCITPLSKALEAAPLSPFLDSAGNLGDGTSRILLI